MVSGSDYSSIRCFVISFKKTCFERPCAEFRFFPEKVLIDLISEFELCVMQGDSFSVAFVKRHLNETFK